MNRWIRGAELLVLPVVGCLASAVALAADPADSPLRALLGPRLEGARIVAIRENVEIVTVDLATLALRSLIKHEATARFQGVARPCWSADGKEILYANNGQAYIMNADGSGHRRVLANEKAVFDPSWWDDPETGEPCIIFKTVNGKHWYGRGSSPGATFRYRMKSGVLDKLIDFPCDGGLSPDGRYLGEAYGGCLLAELPGGKVHILYNGKQACNASLSPDNTHRLMHLYLPHSTFGIRNVFDRELWSIEKPVGSQEWQTPRWSNDPGFCAATAQFGKEYKMVLVEIEGKKLVVLQDLPGSWSVPHLWLPAVVTASGTAPTLTDAASAREALDRTEDWPPILAALRTSGVDWAKTLLAAIEADARTQLADARKADNVLQAKASLDELSSKFRDDPIGAEARTILASKSFQQEVKAAPILHDLRFLEQRLRPEPGAKPVFQDKAYLERNRALLVQMVPLATMLQDQYAGTGAAEKAAAIARTYALPKITTEPVSETLVVEATIREVSRVRSAQEIAPYRESVTYIRYGIDRVLKGRYAGAEMIVVHWGMRETRLMPAASWKPGLKQKLTVDRFDAHPKILTVTAARDADDFDLISYWAVDVSAP